MGRIRIDADAKKALAELEAVAKKEQKVADAIEETTKGSKSAGAEARRLSNLRKKHARENETAEQRYTRQLTDARRALSVNKKDKETLAKVEARLRQEYLESTSSYKAQQRARAEAQKQSADQQRSDIALIGRSQKANETAQQKIRREYLETARALRRQNATEKQVQQNRLDFARRIRESNKQTTTSTKRLGRANKSAFSTAGLASYALGLATPTLAAAKLLQILTSIKEEREAAAALLKVTSLSSGNLAQLAGDDPAKLAGLEAASDATFAEGFIRDRDQSNRLTFELESAGRLKDRALFSRLAAIDDAASLARSVGLVAEGFKGGDDVGSSSDLISKAIAAAAPATGVSPSDILAGVALAAKDASKFGLTDEELFSFVSRSAQESGSGVRSGANIRRLFSTAVKKGILLKTEGPGLEAFIKAVRKEGGFGEVSDKQFDTNITKLLGSVEAAKAFEQTKDISALGGRNAEVLRAQATDLVNAVINTALNSERISAAVLQRSGEAANNLSRDQQAYAAAADIAQRDFIIAGERRDGTNEISNSIGQAMLSAFSFFVGPLDVDQDNARFNRLRSIEAAAPDLIASEGGALTLTGQKEDAYYRTLIEEAKKQTDLARQTLEATQNSSPVIPVSSN